MTRILRIADISGGGGAPAAPAKTAPAAPAAPAAPKAPAKAPEKTVDAPPPAPEPDDPFEAMDARIMARRADKDTPEKPEGDKPKEGEKPVEAPEKAKETPPVKPKEEKTFKEPKALREAYDRASESLKAKDSEITALKGKLGELEKGAKETGPVLARVKALEKENEDLKGQIRAVKQEASPEFKEKWDVPWERRLQYTAQRVQGLAVNQADGTARPATWDDFLGVYQLPTAQGIKAAQEAFGESAPWVLQQVEQLKQMQYDRDEALKSEKATWKEKEDQRVANEAKEREEINQFWQTVNKEIADKAPEWYQPDPEDKEGNDLLNLAYGKIDEAFASLGSMTPKDRARFHAQLRNRAAAFPRLVMRLNKAKERIAELEGQLSEKTDSDPNLPGKRPTSEGMEGEDNWRTELRTAMKGS